MLQPTELQSEANRDAVLQRVSQEHKQESDPIDTSEEHQSGTTGAASRLEDIEEVANRHIPSNDSPPG